LRDRLSNGGDFEEGEEACNRRGSETEKANDEERALCGRSPPGTRDPAHQHNPGDGGEVE
jgi:hypothetical protein